MTETLSDSLMVGVVVERRDSTSPWTDSVWQPLAILPGITEGEDWRLLRRGVGWEHYLAGAAQLVLHRSDAKSYRFNIAEETPKLYVVLRRDPDGAPERPWRLLMVTAAPDEAQSMAESGEDLVEPVAMPEVVREWVRTFAAKCPADEPFRKRQRT
jgi:molybdopterin-guanine dinucleotide biosynthesis protein A